MEDPATTAGGGVPECPECGRAMVKRTARRGPSAGREFWGCTNYPRCKGTRPGSHGDTARHSDHNPTNARDGSSLNSGRSAHGQGTGSADADAKRAEVFDQPYNPRRRVDWSDATLRRSGWRAHNATVGASLRSLPDEHFATLANCWVAREERPELRHERRSEHDGAKRLVAATMRKILARGSAPPLHPDAERALLEAAGLGHRIVAMDGTGDVGPRLAAPAPLDEGDFAVPADDEATFDVSLTESPAESRFVEWANRQVPGCVRWLIPQPSLDLLVAAAEGTARPARASPIRDRSDDGRCDFLFAPPGAEPVVIEVDGSQHTEQKSVDRHRDGRLAAVGVRTVRVTTRDLAEEDGAGLRKVAAVLRAAPAAAGTMQPLVWAPIQVHRLMLGLCEAIEGSYLHGDRWTVEVHDPTGLAADLAGPYLELLDALDRMWGGGNVAPTEAVLVCDGRERIYRRTPDGAYRASASEALGQRADTRIILDCCRTSSEVLPESDEVPTVVIRSTGLQALMRDSARGPVNRPEPFVSCDSIDTRGALEVVLRAVFAKERLLEGQPEGITEVLAGRDCAVLLPTGAGKSMIYQLAGLCLPGRTLVVDPLVALIHDQIEGLRKQGIDRAVGISSRTARMGREAADAYFTFITPERLQRQQFRDELTEASQVAPVNLVVIDEAHCVSEWGHDFRPAYLNFGGTLRSACRGALGVPPLLALTGTASRAVLTDVLFQLGIANQCENSIVRPTTFDRPELSYRMVRATPVDSPAALRGELRAMAARFEAVPATFFEPTGRSDDTCSGIVFVPTVNGWHGLTETTDAVSEIIPSAVPYSSAGNPPRDTAPGDWEERSHENSTAFKENHAAAIVTTKAFGMGIDKPNVRWIMHYGLPGSIEAFYQEVGRAGRDRRSAWSVLILTEHDAGRNRRRLGASEGSDTVRRPRASSERDDVDTALYFHRSSFPAKAKEHMRLLRVFDALETGDRRLSLEHNEGSTDANKRALHRLAVLGIVDDYCLEGRGRSETAEVRCSDREPGDVVERLLSFVERSQPGRLKAIQDEVDDVIVPHATLRDAVEHCGQVLIDFVYDTIERSRRRSLQEMWLLAGDAVADGEVARKRVLDYLTEGDIAPLVQELAESGRFSYADWTTNWAAIASENDAREWRSTAARLLESYPDHPGLLASRGLGEALLPDGDLVEFQRHLEQSMARARDRYQAGEDDVEAMILWFLHLLADDGSGELNSSLRPTLQRARTAPIALAGAVVGAAQRAGLASGPVAAWLQSNWRSDRQLAALKLADSLKHANDLASRAATRYGRNRNG